MQKSDAIIILGCSVVGGSPCPMLKERLDTGYMSWLLNPKSVIVVSGGQGENEPAPEAVVMANYLLQRGVLRENLIMEGKSHCTAQNIGFSIEAMERYGIDHNKARVIIVSNGFHIPRATMLARRFGLKEVTGLPAPTPGKWNRLWMYCIREPLAWIKSLIFDWPSTNAPNGRRVVHAKENTA